MAFVAVALPAIGSLASAALPALGTAATGIGSALGSLPVVGSALSGLGSGLGSMFTGLGGASGIPALTGTLGAGGGLGGMLGLGGGGAGGGGGLFGQGGLKNLFQPSSPLAGKGIVSLGSGGNANHLVPGPTGGIGGGFGLGNLFSGLEQGLSGLANSPLVKGINTAGKIASIMDPGGASYSNVGTLGGPAAGTAGGATAANIQPHLVAKPTGGAPGAIQYGTPPGVLNFMPGTGTVVGGPGGTFNPAGSGLWTQPAPPSQPEPTKLPVKPGVTTGALEADKIEDAWKKRMAEAENYYAEEAERNKTEYVDYSTNPDGEWKTGDDFLYVPDQDDIAKNIGDEGTLTDPATGRDRKFVIVGIRSDGRVIDYID